MFIGEVNSNLNTQHLLQQATKRYAKANQANNKEQENTTDTKSGIVLDISKEGKELYEDSNLQALEALAEEMRTQGESPEVESTKELTKMLEIARRIANGDKVPFKDERKLMEYNPKLYLAAKNAAELRKNNKPKKYDSLFEDEEKKPEEENKAEGENNIESTEGNQQDTSGEAEAGEAAEETAE